MASIKYIVYSSDLEGNEFIENQKSKGVFCISVLDARSAVYVATGISAQNKEMVLVCLNSSNSSRSAFSGMTEAYYRKLPIVLVTFGKGLDYSKEIKDVALGHYIINDVEEMTGLLDNEAPMHIEVTGEVTETKKVQCSSMKIIGEVLTKDDYLYISQGIAKEDLSFNCKTVYGGMSNCLEGALANVLGASLAKKRRRYVGLLSEEEFLHDMNTLGNINVNDSLLYILVCDKKNKLIEDYARSLSFDTKAIMESELKEKELLDIVNTKKKTVLLLCKEA